MDSTESGPAPTPCVTVTPSAIHVQGIIQRKRSEREFSRKKLCAPIGRLEKKKKDKITQILISEQMYG